MAISTRGVLAIMAGGLLVAGVIAPRVGRGVLGSWLLALGLGGATLWSALSVAWSMSNPDPLTPEGYLAMAAMAVAGAAYFGDRARRERPPG